MLFVLICTDKPNSTAIRMDARPRHLAYIEAHRSRVPIAGPFTSEDGQSMTGSLIVLDADSLEAARAFSADDPYVQAGLFSSVEIRPWKWTIGAPKA